ncbi:MAG: hypothetical protein P4L27_08775 [Ignavibacteriaceae bacterium]|nr:hypothetical protein [Ignavibacteriaceae bacterium]
MPIIYFRLIIPYKRSRESINSHKEEKLYKVYSFEDRKSTDSHRDEKLYKDYSLKEWSNLTFNQKRDIWNHYWNRYDNEKGFKTRQNIINAFKDAYPELNKLSIETGFGYFGWDVGMIYVILEDSSIRVPSKFSDISINKGKLISRVNSKEIIVSWKRYGGSGNFTLESTTDHTL